MKKNYVKVGLTKVSFGCYILIISVQRHRTVFPALTDSGTSYAGHWHSIFSLFVYHFQLSSRELRCLSDQNGGKVADYRLIGTSCALCFKVNAKAILPLPQRPRSVLSQFNGVC